MQKDVTIYRVYATTPHDNQACQTCCQISFRTAMRVALHYKSVLKRRFAGAVNACVFIESRVGNSGKWQIRKMLFV